jgi:dCTP deaminase
MAVLARDRILELIRSGALKIEPFDEGQVGAGSVDLHLGTEFRVFKKAHGVFRVTDDLDYTQVTEAVRVKRDGHILMMPGELIHGITEETVTLPSGLAAFIEGRSSLARVGLLTHLSSGFVHPGTSNRTVLEIANLSPIPLAIVPGIRICQLILIEVRGKGKYTGRFARQTNP